MQETSKFQQIPLASPSGMSLILGTLRGTFGGLFLFLFLIVINGLQMASLVLWPFSRKLFRAFNRGCANTWWGTCVLASKWIYGIRLIMTGDPIPVRENAIIFANHQQMPDIVALMLFAWTKSRLGDLKWFVKDPIKYVPGVGWGMLFLDCLFLKRNWDSDEGKIRRTFAKFRNQHIPIWLISFSEGTRLKPGKLAKSQEYARAQGLPVPQHTLVPRTKGFVASVIGLRDYATAVYDVTIAYEGGVPSLWQYTCGWSRRIHMHVRRYEIRRLPNSDKELSAWLRQRFVEKDALLEGFFEKGRFLEARCELQPKDEPAPMPYVSLSLNVTPEA